MRERLLARIAGLAAAAVTASARLRACRAELALAVALLIGWASLTAGVRTLVPASARAAVWPFAIALLCFAGCGFAFVGRLAMRGLYASTRPAPRER